MIRAATRATALAVLLAFAPVALGQDDGSSDVVPVATGDTAPFDGLLVPEQRFVLFLKAETDARDLRFQLTIEKKYALAIETTYRKALEDARPWYREPWFIGALFFVIGVGFAAASVAVGVKVVQANR